METTVEEIQGVIATKEVELFRLRRENAQLRQTVAQLQQQLAAITKPPAQDAIPSAT